MNATSRDERGCGCSSEDILAFVEGELGGDAGLRVARHLGECGPCLEAAVDFRWLGAAVDESCSCALVRWHRFDVPFGTMRVAATERGLARVTWRDQEDDAFVAELEARHPDHLVVRDPEALGEAQRQLRAYFAGERVRFDVPVDLAALSPFEQEVLAEARKLAHGEVVPYATLARRIGRPRAYRAVGNALGRNPVPIVVPCHRVVRSDGSLGGYGGGVEYKASLLRHEGRGDLLGAGAG